VSLRPALSATLGNLRYDTHATSCEAWLAPLPRGCSAEVRLPARARFEAGPGDEASLEADGGEGAGPILTGTVRAVRRDLDAIAVTIADAAADLAAYRPSSTFERQGAARIVRTLAADIGIVPGDVDLDLDLAAYVAHPGRTAAEHVADLARLAGALALTDGAGRLAVRPRPSGPATAALRYGREITGYEVRREPVVNGQRFAIGSGPAGSTSAPDALRHTVGVLPAGAEEGGPGVRRYPAPALRTPAAAAAASTALQTAAAARSERLIARCFLLPALRPGDVIEVQDLPGGLAGGPWLLTRVHHRVEAGAGTTTLEAETAGAGSLLGQLLGAIGGLL
jgi:hypothetical protein